MNQDIIERYLNKDMTPDERMEFEAKMNKDPKLEQEVLQFQKAINALKIYERSALKSRLKEREERIYKTKQTKNTGNWIWYFLAGIGFTLTIWFFNIGKKNLQGTTETGNSINKNNSSIQSGSQSIPVDSIKLEKQNSPKDSMKSEVKDPEELFAANFVPYKDELLESAVRGDEEKSTFEEFQYLYLKGNYAKALSMFEALEPEIKDNDNVLFLKAIALMAIHKSNEASSILQGIIENKSSRYLSEAYWYLALCQIQMGAFTKAKIYLNNSQLKDKPKAKKLIEKLN